jgi:hypothetical protein
LIAVDTNVLVYAHREESPQHESARERLRELAEGAATWAIPVFCVGEFLRVMTHPRFFDPPFTAAEACDAISRVLASPSVRILSPGDRFPEILLAAIREARAVANLVMDAQIVAVCRESGASALLTEDRDFARFPGFRTVTLGDD